MFWQILPWFISCLTVTSMWLAGNKSPHAWTVGIINQVFWFSLMLHSQLWGLLPLSAVLSFVYIRNLVMWSNDEKEEEEVNG
jgi:nicotinamide riboside transporter PnuC